MPKCLPRALPPVLAAAALLATASAASAGQLSVALQPEYVEGLTGANGWFTVAVTATYTCTPADGEVTVTCPPQEVFRDGTGAASASGASDANRTRSVTRTATFARRTGRTRTDTVALGYAGGPLRVDTQPPPAPVITGPSAGVLAAAVLPGTSLRAAYECPFDDDASGPAPLNACVGSTAAGGELDTGNAGDRATWGARSLTVTAKDAAGHETSTIVTYRIAGAYAPSQSASAETTRVPGLRNTAAMRPKVGALVGRGTVLRWTATRGAALYNVQVFRITASGGYTKVASAFPRRNRLTLRLAAGRRYVWRVWPYMARTAAYRRTPVGVSWFRTRG
ncbi:MAG: hypothetical protein IT200_07480 [Thermoleophilia bacterium]|nr:hypothetical protein [Thermoleophilia bacterium]